MKRILKRRQRRKVKMMGKVDLEQMSLVNYPSVSSSKVREG